MFNWFLYECSWRVNADDPTALTRLLDLPDLIVTGLEYDDFHETVIVLCEHAGNVAVCPTCRQPSPHPYQRKRRVVRDLPWAGKRCLLEFWARRFFCARCGGPFTEELT